MNTTLLVLCLVLIVYLASCAYQWRRLNREDKNNDSSPDPPGPRR